MLRNNVAAIVENIVVLGLKACNALGKGEAYVLSHLWFSHFG